MTPSSPAAALRSPPGGARRPYVCLLVFTQGPVRSIPAICLHVSHIWEGYRTRKAGGQRHGGTPRGPMLNFSEARTNGETGLLNNAGTRTNLEAECLILPVSVRPGAARIRTRFRILKHRPAQSCSRPDILKHAEGQLARTSPSLAPSREEPSSRLGGGVAPSPRHGRALLFYEHLSTFRIARRARGLWRQHGILKTPASQGRRASTWSPWGAMRARATRRNPPRRHPWHRCRRPGRWPSWRRAPRRAGHRARAR